MTFEIFISSAIVSALITAYGNYRTTKTAQRIAKETAMETANKEIEKLRIELAYQDKVRAEESIKEIDDEFAQMIGAVNNYIFISNLDAQANAATKISAFMRHNIAPMEAVLVELLDVVDKTSSDTQQLQAAFRPLLHKLSSLHMHIRTQVDTNPQNK